MITAPLRGKHGATSFAVVLAAVMAALPPPGQPWSLATAGTGGLVLWPLFGATNQLLGGLAFLVISFYLWRRGRAVWFVVIPMIFMLVMPAWAMIVQAFVGGADNPSWLSQGRGTLVGLAVATLALEAWMIVEAVRLFPRARGVMEDAAVEPLLAEARQV
jgi:carbon starvation protein